MYEIVIVLLCTDNNVAKYTCLLALIRIMIILHVADERWIDKRRLSSKFTLCRMLKKTPDNIYYL